VFSDESMEKFLQFRLRRGFAGSTGLKPFFLVGFTLAVFLTLEDSVQKQTPRRDFELV